MKKTITSKQTNKQNNVIQKKSQNKETTKNNNAYLKPFMYGLMRHTYS